MSLARAFTTRRHKAEESETPIMSRAASQRVGLGRPIKRSEISLPVALISTTNMLSYEAPDIAGTTRITTNIRTVSSSSVASHASSSGDESDRSDASSTGGHSHHTDATSVADDLSPLSPGLNYLGPVIKPMFSPVMSSSPHSRSESTFSTSTQPIDSPQLPSRAPSHSKQAHVLSHKRSVQRMTASSIASSRHETSSRCSADMFSCRVDSFVSSPVSFSAAPSSHPFGKELEQLNEAAEEFGHAVRDAEADADRNVMKSRNLAQFCAAEYMAELSDVYATTFAEDMAAFQPMTWI